jgi:Carboxypeptidase regulatory-like domain
MKALLGLVLLAVSASLVAEQANRRAAAVASIEGVVLRDGTNQPVVGATVTVRLAGATPLTSLVSPLVGKTISSSGEEVRFPTTTTDNQGRFVLTDVSEGRYRLYASASGYATREAGQSAHAAAGTQIKVTPGQNIKDLAVLLVATGRVSGRITDRGARPLVGIHVSVGRPRYDALGNQGFDRIELVTTNDRGEYRISEIPPGFYYLLAGGNQSTGRGSSAPPTTVPYAATYYPGETELGRAARLEVKEGSDLEKIDVALERQALRHVRGTIMDVNTGRPPESATIAISAGGSIRSNSRIYNPADGTFELSDLEPMQYRLQVAPGVVGTANIVSGAAPTLMAMIDLTSSNAEGLQFRVPIQFGSVSGRVRIENSPTVDGRTPHVSLIPTNGNMTVTPRVNADATFDAIELQAVEYTMRVTGMAPGSYVKAVLLDGVDVPDNLIRITRGQRQFLDVVLSLDSAQIQGVVRDEVGRPMAGVFTGLVPDQRQKRMDLYTSTVSEADGTFTFRGIAPGNYKVFAWEDAQPFMYFDAELLKRTEDHGVPTTVTEKGTASVDVRISRSVR